MMLAPPFENFRPFKVDDIKYNTVRNLEENNLEELLTIAKVETRSGTEGIRRTMTASGPNFGV